MEDGGELRGFSVILSAAVAAAAARFAQWEGGGRSNSPEAPAPMAGPGRGPERGDGSG